jgi:hypothetical protein
MSGFIGLKKRNRSWKIFLISTHYAVSEDKKYREKMGSFDQATPDFEFGVIFAE